MPDYDYAVVGGGISGLMTALRLAKCGFRTGLFEKGELGSEASTGNHGMIHSGALYAEIHPEVTSLCSQANTLFRQTFPDAIVPLEPTWYFATAPRLDLFKRLWSLQGLTFTEVDASTWTDFLRPEHARTLACAALPDFIISPRRILVELTQQCLDLGVEISPLTPVHEVILRQGAAEALRIGLRETVSARQIILCSGLGVIPLLKQVKSRAWDQLRPRLGLMVVFDNARLNRAVLCLEHGGPTIAPTYGSPVLASLFNGVQPSIKRNGKWPVAVTQVAEVVRQVETYLQDDVLSADTSRAYVCSKTEIAIGTTAWSTRPTFVCMNHAKLDGIKHLWSLLPGKWTLAFHATQSLVSQILHEDMGLALPLQAQSISAAAEELVAIEPWWDADRWPYQSFSSRETSGVASVAEREQPAPLGQH
jgi:glycine/D-amino acid oxidase-like deaminating enzyme